MKLPKILYVKMEKDGGIVYPISAETLIDIVEMGRTTRVGVYKLCETTYAECRVKTSRTKKELK
jgi:hypothetical protein